MKNFSDILERGIGRSQQNRQAFTLVELMISMAIFTLVISGIIGMHLYGLRTFDILSVKLDASDDARTTVDTLLDDIRSAGTGTNCIQIGTGTASSFTQTISTNAQKGNALQVYTNDASQYPNSWVRYFYDSTNNMLKRVTYGSSAVSVSASTITNDTSIFQAVDYTGNVVSNSYDVSSVLVTLTFTKLKNPEVFIGEGNQYDFYGLQVIASRRSHP